MNPHTLKLQITDKCQYDCFYCKYKSNDSADSLMTYDSLLKMVLAITAEGISNIEITGGEPLLFDGIVELVRDLKDICHAENVYITTNGLLLSEKINALKEAGISGINIHLDTIGSYGFKRTTGMEQVLNTILTGIWRTTAMKIPAYVTAVIHKYSEEHIPVIAGLAKSIPVTVRLAVMKDADTSISGKELLNDIIKKTGTHYNSDNDSYSAGGWRGKFTFCNDISGAFNSDGTVDLRCIIH